MSRPATGNGWYGPPRSPRGFHQFRDGVSLCGRHELLPSGEGYWPHPLDHEGTRDCDICKAALKATALEREIEAM